MNAFFTRFEADGSVAFAPTHCKPFDLGKPEQWVFGYTLCVYPNRLDYTQFTVMPYWSNFRGRISSK